MFSCQVPLPTCLKVGTGIMINWTCAYFLGPVWLAPAWLQNTVGFPVCRLCLTASCPYVLVLFDCYVPLCAASAWLICASVCRHCLTANCTCVLALFDCYVPLIGCYRCRCVSALLYCHLPLCAGPVWLIAAPVCRQCWLLGVFACRPCLTSWRPCVLALLDC
jgi:hypothetical protein